VPEVKDVNIKDNDALRSLFNKYITQDGTAIKLNERFFADTQTPDKLLAATIEIAKITDKALDDNLGGGGFLKQLGKILLGTITAPFMLVASWFGVHPAEGAAERRAPTEVEKKYLTLLQEGLKHQAAIYQRNGTLDVARGRIFNQADRGLQTNINHNWMPHDSDGKPEFSQRVKNQKEELERSRNQQHENDILIKKLGVTPQVWNDYVEWHAVRNKQSSPVYPNPTELLELARQNYRVAELSNHLVMKMRGGQPQVLRITRAGTPAAHGQQQRINFDQPLGPQMPGLNI
jgi:hypothetical protein